MDWIVVLLVGAFVGWLASVILHTRAEQGPLLDVIVGIVGAALGRGVFGRILGVESAAHAGQFSFWGVMWAVIGAVVLVGLLKALKVFRTT